MESSGIKVAHTREQKVILLREVRFIFLPLLHFFPRVSLCYIFDLISQTFLVRELITFRSCTNLYGTLNSIQQVTSPAH